MSIGQQLIDSPNPLFLSPTKTSPRHKFLQFPFLKNEIDYACVFAIFLNKNTYFLTSPFRLYPALLTPPLSPSLPSLPSLPTYCTTLPLNKQSPGVPC